MKKTLLISFCISAVSFLSIAQSSDCNGNRYMNRNFFTDVDTMLNVTYGSNQGVGSGSNQSLELDIFEPANDTLATRPLIILAHGGSFTGGNKN